jgi:hypothetical protein
MAASISARRAETGKDSGNSIRKRGAGVAAAVGGLTGSVTALLSQPLVHVLHVFLC